MSIIDADGHFVERAADIRKYLKAPWNTRLTALWPADQPWDSALFDSLGSTRPFGQMDPEAQVAEWLRLMDREDIEQAVLFPTSCGQLVKLQETDFAVAVARACNDYVAGEFNRRSGRLKGVGVLPLRSPDAAVREMNRATSELGIRAFELITSGLPLALGDPFYDPVWAEAEKLGVAMCVHGTRSHSDEVGGAKLRTFAEVHCYAFAASMLLQFTSVIFNGIPVRFPGLRLAFLEIGVSWLPYYLDRMDEHWEKRGRVEAPSLQVTPSELVRDASIYFSLEAGETLLPETIAYIGDGHLLYATDIPHWDNEFPENLHALQNHPRVPAASKARILHDNAAQLYGLQANRA